MGFNEIFISNLLIFFLEWTAGEEGRNLLQDTNSLVGETEIKRPAVEGGLFVLFLVCRNFLYPLISLGSIKWW